MNSPQFLSLFSAVFLALSGYNLFTGYKRLRDARAHGVNIKWFKQINILTGTEYLLLALVFLFSMVYRNTAVPANIRSIVLPVYLLFLLAAAVVAGLVIRQGILNTRALRNQARSSSSAIKSNGTSTAAMLESASEDQQQRVASIDRRRERRRNAAAARRRRAGKA